ncbi:MAG: CopD family protein [Marinovum sp.]|nr:CopD family protein [Marinovum sp.]
MEWVKIIHILCVMGWMTSIFAVPRALIYWRREYDRLGENGPLGDLTYRLYRFSAGLSMIAVFTGLWLAWWHGFPGWAWLKLGLVAALLVHYLWTGRMVRAAQKGVFERSERWLRVFNETSVIGAIAVLWVVVVKPF